MKPIKTSYQSKGDFKSRFFELFKTGMAIFFTGVIFYVMYVICLWVWG